MNHDEIYFIFIFIILFGCCEFKETERSKKKKNSGKKLYNKPFTNFMFPCKNEYFAAVFYFVNCFELCSNINFKDFFSII